MSPDISQASTQLTPHHIPEPPDIPPSLTELAEDLVFATITTNNNTIKNNINSIVTNNIVTVNARSLIRSGRDEDIAALISVARADILIVQETWLSAGQGEALCRSLRSSYLDSEAYHSSASEPDLHSAHGRGVLLFISAKLAKYVRSTAAGKASDKELGTAIRAKLQIEDVVVTILSPHTSQTPAPTTISSVAARKENTPATASLSGLRRQWGLAHFS